MNLVAKKTLECPSIEASVPPILDTGGLFIQEGQEIQDFQEIQECQCLSINEVLAGHEPEIEGAIQQTRPKNEDQLNRCVFNLCRKLQGIDGLDETPADRLEPIARQWWESALLNLPRLTFTDVWSEFQYCWEKIRYPEGQIFEYALDSAQTAMNLPEQQNRYDCERTRLLVRLCYHLQELGNDETFFLGYNKAGEVLKCSHTWAGKRLNMLVKDGILEKVKEPSRGPVHRRSTEYHFVEGDKK